MQLINEYPAKIFTVMHYLQSPSSDPINKKTIIIDSIKCVAIGASLAGLIRYSRG